jgi:hypothetical protein
VNRTGNFYILVFLFHHLDKLLSRCFAILVKTSSPLMLSSMCLCGYHFHKNNKPRNLRCRLCQY